MLRLIGTLLLVAAAGNYWLVTQHRHTPLGMQALELQGAIGIPISYIAFGAGIVLWALTVKRTRPHKHSAPQKHKEQHTQIQNTKDLTWVSDVIDRARSLQWEQGARLQFDLGSGIPFGLQLTRTTPEVTRRSVEQFAAFLYTIPTPPRAKVRYIEAQTQNVPRHHTVRGALRRHFHQNDFHVVSQDAWVDILFHDSDPAWKERPFLFLDRG